MRHLAEPSGRGMHAGAGARRCFTHASSTASVIGHSGAVLVPVAVIRSRHTVSSAAAWAEPPEKHTMAVAALSGGQGSFSEASLRLFFFFLISELQHSSSSH